VVSGFSSTGGKEYTNPYEFFFKRNNIGTVNSTNSIQHKQMVEKRLKQTSNPIVKDIYEEYLDQIVVSDSAYMGTAHYNPYSHSIKFNATADMHNPEGECTTYFHESGHLIDDFAGNGHAWLSSDPDFRLALEYDVNKYVADTMNNFGCSIDEAYDIVSTRLEGDTVAGVSDIFGSLTQCKCQGDWGHSVSYWERDKSNVEKEAFANMFEVSLGSPEKLQKMKAFFPTAYAKFESLIKNR